MTLFTPLQEVKKKSYHILKVGRYYPVLADTCGPLGLSQGM